MPVIAYPKLVPRRSTSKFSNDFIALGITVLLIAIPIRSFGQGQYDTTSKNAAPWIGERLNGTPCAGRGQGYGPFDYLKRKQFRLQLTNVNGHHFTYRVEQLIKGESSSLIGDLDYTLSAWPNHHRALAAVIRLKTFKKKDPVSPVECYLQRAINFSPKDFTPLMLYGVYLHKLGSPGKALKQYQAAERLSPKNPELHYNMGLVLVGMKKYDEAKIHAVKAYNGGYPFPGLKRQLSRLGYWKDE